jgi:signal transduction histidine kinase
MAAKQISEDSTLIHGRMTPEKPKVLVVDDNINNIYLIEDMLSDLDIGIVRALSGFEAIEQTSVNEFALVLMDVQMPGMDGFETVENIRRDPKNELLPIIYITAGHHDVYYRTKGIKTGAVDFIAKPLIADIFIGKVNIFINLFRHRKSMENEIIRRAEVESELLKAKEVAEDAAKAKQQFLSTMSHEIRTPLNAIINTAGLLRDEDPRPDQLDNIEILHFSASNLLRLINDILDYSKIDSGKFQFETIDFELRKLINGIYQSFEYEAKRKGLDFFIEIGNNVPKVIKGDSVRLSQILFNLVGNALKFTHQGYVKVKIELHKELRGIAELRMQVTDTGIGIPEDKQQYIFESFTQASSSTTRKYGGTGLGLAITRKLVELQGGVLNLRSKEGEGSTFEIMMKFQSSEKNQIDDDMLVQRTFRSLKGLKVLVVEDNVINQKIVMKFLNKWDVATDVADNGKIAVDKVKQNRYDVVLMDLHMPEMNGYDATKMIRELNDDYFHTVPIIALTASALMEDRERIYQFGMSGFIIKPFNPTELYWKISPFLH